MKQILQGDKDYICKKNINEERPNAFPMRSEQIKNAHSQ